ncbi:retrovirus-related pol polyprotein from transposon TNT 1-94 [Tanacetum coccineum]
MLLATKDEAGVHLDEEENDFMHNNAYGDNMLEELNATMIMMACIQPTDDKSDAKPTYDDEFISEVNASQIDMVNGLFSKSDHEQQCSTTIKQEITEEVREMLEIFKSMERKVEETSQKDELIQNEIDRLLEASLEREIRDCVLISVVVRAKNKYLLMIISEIKDKLKTVEKGKNVNTKHNLFSVRQFCDGVLEVAFRSNTCYVRNLEGDDLLTGSRDSNLYTISIFEMAASSPVYFLSIKDETLEMIIKFITEIQQNMKVQVLKVQSDNGTEFKNEKLISYYEKLGIMHQTSIAQTPQQNGVAEAISTACFTQNRSLLHTRYNKTPYELIKGRKLNVQYFHVFDSLCYPTNDHDDLGKMKPKADIYHEPPQLVSSSEEPIANEPTTPVSDNHSNEQVQEDVAKIDGNTFMNPFASPEFKEA